MTTTAIAATPAPARTPSNPGRTPGRAPVDNIGWQILVVRVALNEDYEDGVRKLRALEAWLAGNHRPVALFRADGRPRSEMVCLAVPADLPGKALAWRTFCGDLGLAAGMVQWRTAPCPPPPSPPPFSMDFN